MEELTGFLAQAAAGDALAFDRAVTLPYDDLAGMARARRRRGGRVTLSDTGAPEHESWLRLRPTGTLRVEDRSHLIASAARDPAFRHDIACDLATLLTTHRAPSRCLMR